MRAFWNKRKYLIGQIALCCSSGAVPLIGKLPLSAMGAASIGFWCGLLAVLISISLRRAEFAARHDMRFDVEIAKIGSELNSEILAEARQIIADREFAKIAAQNALAKSKLH